MEIGFIHPTLMDVSDSIHCLDKEVINLEKTNNFIKHKPNSNNIYILLKNQPDKRKKKKKEINLGVVP